jgi:hypothetical protein
MLDQYPQVDLHIVSPLDWNLASCFGFAGSCSASYSVGDIPRVIRATHINLAHWNWTIRFCQSSELKYFEAALSASQPSQ